MIEKYILEQPVEIQPQLFELYYLLQKLVPEGTIEKIAWGMPTFYYHGNLIHFAAHKHHIGIYPGPKPIELLAERLKSYKTSKGAIQIPYATPADEVLIQDILTICIQRNQPK